MDLRVQRGHRRVRRRPPGNRGSSIRIGSPTAEGQKRNPRQLLYGTPVMYLKKKVEKEQKLNTKIKRTKLFFKKNNHENKKEKNSLKVSSSKPKRYEKINFPLYTLKLWAWPQTSFCPSNSCCNSQLWHLVRVKTSSPGQHLMYSPS